MILSIIIPVYNVEPFVERCIRSCEAQNIAKNKYEIICINDGSKDNSLKIISRIADEFPNIHVFSQPNAGLSAARNHGMRVAKGDYYMFVDSDDWIAENCLGMLTDKLREERPDVLTFCAANVVNGVPLGIAPAWRYSSIAYPQVGGGLKQLIDSLQDTSLLRVGAQYNLDSLTLERKRISQLLRNRGYYYFRPEYMEYLADTTAGRRQVALRLNLRPNVPQAALMPYRVGDVTVRLTNIKPGPADTLRLPDATVIARRPLKIRPRVLSRALTLRPGQLFTVDAQNRTQTDLNKLGIFRSVNLSVTPLDSLRGSDTLDVEIDARFDYPLEAALETDVTSKSNSFIGPGVTFRVSNNNLFRGGEVLSVKLNGSYEWQTGNKNSGGRSSRLNSYELGLNANLDIPRLLLPRSMTRRQKYPGSTSFQLGVDLMNRPSFFRLIAFSGSAGYNFQTSPYSRHSLTVFKLTYNKLLHTTDSFDRTMDENPAIAMSFRNQFVPSINYTYTFERTYGATGNRRFYWQNSVTSAGNLLSGILRAFGERQPQTLFGNRFSQFVKEVSEVKFYHRIGRRNNWLATRLLVGAGYAYGNSSSIPFERLFYCGGSTSMRGWLARTLGPGGDPKRDFSDYPSQLANFKLETNLEARFPVWGILQGALFFDLGNIWFMNQGGTEETRFKIDRFYKQLGFNTGLGARFDFGFFVFRLDWGIKLHNPNEPAGERWIQHFRLKNTTLNFGVGYPF